MTSGAAGEAAASGRERRRDAVAHVLVEPDHFGPGTVDDDIAHHLGQVLRVRDGESVTVTDGAGRWFSAVARRVATSIVLEATGDVAVEERDEPELVIASAIPKGDRVDWLVQKATEVGADRIVLLHAERSVVRWEPDRAAKRVERLQRIADEATRQSRRVWRTAIVAPIDAETVLAQSVVAEPGGRPLTASDRTIAVGPEGGWSDRELASAGDRIGLSANVLRTETAAVVAATLAASQGKRAFAAPVA